MNFIFGGLERGSIWKESSIIVGHAELGMLLTYSYLSDRHSGRWIICQQKCFNLTAKNLQWNIHPQSFHYFKGILCVPLFWMLFGNILWKQYRGNVSPFAGELRPQKDPEEKTALINTMHYNVSQNVITICKTFPEAQRTQGTMDSIL